MHCHIHYYYILLPYALLLYIVAIYTIITYCKVFLFNYTHLNEILIFGYQYVFVLGNDARKQFIDLYIVDDRSGLDKSSVNNGVRRHLTSERRVVAKIRCSKVASSHSLSRESQHIAVR